jgi:hypothetical protein
VNAPALLLLIVTVQLAVFVPRVGLEQLSDSDVGAGEMLGTIDVSVAVEPDGSAVVVIVNWCCSVIPFVPFGLIEMFASTNRLIAGPELPVVPSVD